MDSMKVFISGTTGTESLNENDLAFLEQIVEGNRTILIGDIFGIDKAVQEYLLTCNYRHVIVYHLGEKVETNIGSWKTKQILNTENLTKKSLQRIKDKAMAEDCDSGLFFCNGESESTKHAMDCMDRLDKYYLVLSEGGLGVGNMHKINNMIML